MFPANKSESWKAEEFGDAIGRQLDAWQWNDWRAGRHGSIEWSGGERILSNIWMESWRDGKEGAIGLEHWRAGRLRALGTGLLESWKAEGMGTGLVER